MAQIVAGTAAVAAAAKAAAAVAADGQATTAAGEVVGTAARVAKPWGQWLRERISRRGTVDDQIDEAAQQRLGKDSKIQTAMESVFVGQMQQIAQDELDDVRALKDKYLNKGGRGMLIGGSGKAGERHSDLIIGDNIKIETPRGSSAMAVLAAGALGAAAAMFVPGLLKPEPAPTAAPAAAPQANGGAPGPVLTPPDVKVDDLRLRVRWRQNPQTGKIETEIIEQAK
jgi:hypothetical protein